LIDLFHCCDFKLNEAELNVTGDAASYKDKLEVLRQQQELIEDEAEQEQVGSMYHSFAFDFLV
jgi:hypothetical protein